MGGSVNKGGNQESGVGKSDCVGERRRPQNVDLAVEATAYPSSRSVACTLDEIVEEDLAYLGR